MTLDSSSTQMASHDPLQLDLQLSLHSLSSIARHEVLTSLWQCERSLEQSLQDDNHSDSFLLFYCSQCTAALQDRRVRSLIKTHRDLVDIIIVIKHPDTTRASLKEQLQTRLPAPLEAGAEDALSGVIDLAAGILSMTYVGSFQQIIGPSRTTLQWKDEEGLKSLLSREFYVVSPMGPRVLGPVKLERLFTARNLERIAGMEITWTSNLADHLRLLDDDRRVVIFHHAHFLNNIQKRYIHASVAEFMEKNLRMPSIARSFRLA
jgi:hypothetical protein